MLLATPPQLRLEHHVLLCHAQCPTQCRCLFQTQSPHLLSLRFLCHRLLVPQCQFQCQLAQLGIAVQESPLRDMAMVVLAVLAVISFVDHFSESAHPFTLQGVLS